MNRIVFLGLLLFVGFYSTAQRDSGFSYGIGGGILFNSATMPDVEINTDINDILSGENLVKGKANYADLTFNYRFGGFVKYDHGFGFGLLEINYSTTKIQKDIELSSDKFFGERSVNLATLERDYSYLDIAISYNIYLSDKMFFSLGITPAILLSNTGKQSPNKTDWRVLTGFGFNFTDNISISSRIEFGLNEVYDDSYIHHIMIPVTLRFAI